MAHYKFIKIIKIISWFIIIIIIIIIIISKEMRTGKFVRLFWVLGLLDSWGMEEFHHEIILILLHSKLYCKKFHEPYQKKSHYLFWII